MQTIIEIACLLDAMLAVPKGKLRRCPIEIELSRPVEAQTSLPDILRVFRRVILYLHPSSLSTLS
jgi:hypothetical protein